MAHPVECFPRFVVDSNPREVRGECGVRMAGADNRKVFQGASHRYVVLEPLGSGGMGSTWVVFDHKMGDLKTFAIKVLDPELARSQSRAREHFVHEARATAALDHPNIVSVMWIDELTDGTPLYAMELLNGESVGAALKRGPMPVQVALNVVIDVLDGLHFAHKHALVHQDIKPSNIVLHRNARGESVAKIIDFGVVRTADDADRGFAGTFAYAAPEQIRGGTVGPAADIFGAGGLLYEILTGTRPFASYASSVAGAIARLDKNPPSILDFKDFPLELADVVARSLSPRVADRPESAKAFALELRKIGRELDSPAPKAQHISHVGRPILRGALADTTDQAGIEYAEIIARAHAGAAVARSVGASETMQAPLFPVIPALSASAIVNEAAADAATRPERPGALVTEPASTEPVAAVPTSQAATDPPSRVIVAEPNVHPIYVDDSVEGRGAAHRGGLAVPMTLGGPEARVEGAAAVAIARQPAPSSSPPPPLREHERALHRVESGVEPRGQRTDSNSGSVGAFTPQPRVGVPATKGRTVPMYPPLGNAIPAATTLVAAGTKPRYSPLQIRLRRFYQTRSVRIATRLFITLLLSAIISSVTVRFVYGAWPWGLTSARSAARRSP
jgi:tRNA A-37 threonylcarbamoyl transferase component Bud32